jgi:hypothetical protein
MPNLRRTLAIFFKNELKATIALGVLLIVLVSFSLAVGNSYKFDFGDGTPSGLEPGYLPVDGNATMYPVTSAGLQYGWLDPVIEFSNGAAVASKLNRDGNKHVADARFRITGLPNGNYTVSLVSGSLDNGFATKLTVAGKSFSATTQPNEWKTLTLGVEVVNGSLELFFQRAGAGASLWAVNSLTIVPSTAPAEKPTFDVTVQPTAHTVRVGGTAIYRISVNPLSGYASPVDLSIAGLVGEMSAQFSPASAIPPFVSDLTLLTSKNTPITQYDFIVTAKGHDIDAYTVNKSISLLLTNNTNAPTVVKPDTGIVTGLGQGASGTPGAGSLDDAYLQPRTPAEAKQEQKLVDEFARQEEKKLASTKEILEIRDINTINGFALEPIVIPKTALEQSLQYLTAAGIIGTAVDSAPPAAVAAPEARIGFWERLFKTMVSPAL